MLDNLHNYNALSNINDKATPNSSYETLIGIITKKTKKK